MKRFASLLFALAYAAGQGYVYGHDAAEAGCCVRSDAPSMACGEDGHDHGHHHHHRHATCPTCANVGQAAHPDASTTPAAPPDVEAPPLDPASFDAAPEVLAGGARSPPVVRS